MPSTSRSPSTVTAEREVAGAPLHRPSLTDLQHQRIQEDDRVDVVERALLPLAHVVHHRVGDAADQVAANLHPVDLGQVRLDVARRQPARVQGEDLVVEPLETPLPLPDDLRLERALAVAGRIDPHRAVLGRKRLRRRAVTRVVGPAGRLLVRLVAEMLGQLRRHRPLDQPLRQLREHPTGPDDLLLAARASEQLVDHLVGKTVTNLTRRPLLEQARSAGRSLRSPSGLGPQPAGAIDANGLNRLTVGFDPRRHDAPFSSCLHRASDTPAPIGRPPLAQRREQARGRAADWPDSAPLVEEGPEQAVSQ